MSYDAFDERTQVSVMVEALLCGETVEVPYVLTRLWSTLLLVPEEWYWMICSIS